MSSSAEHDIATEGQTIEPLSSDEIDALCERMNAGPGHDAGPLADLADELDDIVEAFDANGEFRTLTAPLGTGEIRETAERVRDQLAALAIGGLVLSMMMQDLVGEYDLPEVVPEWRWVLEHASFAHVRNGEDGVWEFLLNLALTFDGVMPDALKAPIESARAEGFAWILFHQGT